MRHRRTRQLILILAALGALVAAQHFSTRAVQIRERDQLLVRTDTEGVPPKVVLATTALGAFRGIFVDLLWVRAMSLKQEGQFFEMVQVYDWITSLQPHYVPIWDFIAWDFAYNVSVEVALEDRWYWVHRGIRTLRDEGIPLNKRAPRLYDALANIYWHKLGSQTDYARRYYQTELAHMMDAVLQGPGDREFLEALVALPDSREDLLALPKVASLTEDLMAEGLDPLADLEQLLYERASLPQSVRERLEQPHAQDALEIVRQYRVGKVLREKYKLEPEIMLKLNRTFGPLDWRGCDAHAIYWSYRGREVAYGREDFPEYEEKYERLLYFALCDLYRRGKIRISEEGLVYNEPDYRFFDTARKHLKDLLERARRERRESGGPDSYPTGPLSGYVNMLKEAIFLYYFHGMTDKADQWLEYLREIFPNDENLNVPIEVWIRHNVRNFVDQMTIRRTMIIVDASLNNYYLYLSLGDPDTAASFRRRAVMLHEYLYDRWASDPSQPWVGVVPPLGDLLADRLTAILDGRVPEFTETMRARLRAALPEEQIEAAEERMRRKQEREEEIRQERAREEL